MVKPATSLTIILLLNFPLLIIFAQNISPPGSQYQYYCDYTSIDPNTGAEISQRFEWNSSEPGNPWANPTSFQFCDIPSIGAPAGSGTNCRPYIVATNEEYDMETWQERCGLYPN